MSVVRPSTTSLRWAIVLGLGLGLSACGDKPAAPPAAAQAAAADAAVSQAAQAQAAALAALSIDELRNRGRQALREQRIYAPAGNNAIEYYVALRKKSAKPDASAESALMDLSPYAVIAAEQAITRGDFNEAERLRQLIAAADPQAPSLARIADSIAKGRAAIAAAPPPPTEKTPEQLRAEQLAREKAAADAKALQAQAAAAAAQRQTEAAAPAPAPVQQQQAPPPAPEPVVQAPPRPAPTQAAPSRPAPPSGELVPISTPQPAYPPEAARAGTAGEVVLSFTVNTDGSVSNIDIVSAKPRGVFERNAQAAVRRWRFQPIASPQSVTRTFSFSR
jgi:protein TonB